MVRWKRILFWAPHNLGPILWAFVGFSCSKCNSWNSPSEKTSRGKFPMRTSYVSKTRRAIGLAEFRQNSRFSIIAAMPTNNRTCGVLTSTSHLRWGGSDDVDQLTVNVLNSTRTRYGHVPSGDQLKTKTRPEWLTLFGGVAKSTRRARSSVYVSSIARADRRDDDDNDLSWPSVAANWNQLPVRLQWRARRRPIRFHIAVHTVPSPGSSGSRRRTAK